MRVFIPVFAAVLILSASRVDAMDWKSIPCADAYVSVPGAIECFNLSGASAAQFDGRGQLAQQSVIARVGNFGIGIGIAHAVGDSAMQAMSKEEKIKLMKNVDTDIAGSGKNWSQLQQSGNISFMTVEVGPIVCLAFWLDGPTSSLGYLWQIWGAACPMTGNKASVDDVRAILRQSRVGLANSRRAIVAN